MPRAAFIETGVPVALHYSDLDLVGNAINASQEGVQFVEEMAVQGADFWWSLLGARTQQELPLNGGGTQVYVIDGNRSDPMYVEPLDGWLRRRNHRTTNAGIHLVDSIEEHIEPAMDAVAAMDPGVIILGHSLGGTLGRAVARELDKAKPGHVGYVIELGSPKLGSVNNIPFDQSKPLPDRIGNINFVSRADPIVPEPHAISLSGTNIRVRTGHLEYGISRGVREGLAVALQPHGDLFVATGRSHGRGKTAA